VVYFWRDNEEHSKSAEKPVVGPAQVNRALKFKLMFFLSLEKPCCAENENNYCI